MLLQETQLARCLLACSATLLVLVSAVDVTPSSTARRPRSRCPSRRWARGPDRDEAAEQGTTLGPRRARGGPRPRGGAPAAVLPCCASSSVRRRAGARGQRVSGAGRLQEAAGAGRVDPAGGGAEGRRRGGAAVRDGLGF